MTAIVARRIITSRSLPVFLFVLGGVSLDISFGSEGLRIGNVLLILSCLAAIALSMATGRLRSRPRLTIADAAYFAYLGFLAISGLWAPSGLDTMVQVLILTLLWVTTLSLSHEHISTLVRYVVHIAFWAALIAFVLAVIAPDIAFQPNWSGPRFELRGIFHHQLRFGLYMGLALGLLIIARLNGELPLVFQKNLWFYLAVAVLLIATVMARARLYSLELALSLLLVLVLPRAGWARLLLITAIFSLIVIVISNQSALFSELDEGGVDITLTGRTWIWEKSLAVADKSPIWGYGYPSYDHKMFDWMWNNYRPAHPHNSFIQAYFETGIIGLAMVLVMATIHLVVALRNAAIDRRYSYTLFIVATTLFGSLTGANYASKPSAIFTYMLLAIAIDTRRGLAQRYARRAMEESATAPPAAPSPPLPSLAGNPA